MIKKIIIAAMLCTQTFTTVWAQTPYYSNTVDVQNSDFENGYWKYKFTSYDGLSLLLEEGQKHTFMIVNGKISHENIIIENDISFVSLEGICKELNLEQNQFVINNDVISFISLDSKKSIPFKMIDNKIYVPLKQFASAFGASVSYSTAEIMPLYNPLICVDNREQKITKQQALQMTKQKINTYYQNFVQQQTDNEEILTQIQQKINTMKCIEDTASFWVIDAPLLLLVDKTTGEIYYKTGHGNAGHGSYIEKIEKIAEKDFFEYIIHHGI